MRSGMTFGFENRHEASPTRRAQLNCDPACTIPEIVIVHTGEKKIKRADAHQSDLTEQERVLLRRRKNGPPTTVGCEQLSVANHPERKIEVMWLT